MAIFGKCGQCGKPIGQAKKTCGASFAVCNKCKVMLHPHCLGEHRLLHRNRDNMIKDAVNDNTNSLISKVFSSIREKFAKPNANSKD